MKIKHLAPAIVLCLGTATWVVAEDTNNDQSSESSSSNSVSQASTTERSEKDIKVSDQELKKQVTDANKASKVIGMQVKNKQGEDLGIIKDLALDLQSGKVGYAVLAHGTVLGFGGKYVAVPLQALTLQPGAKAFVLDISKQEIAKAPGFNEKDWPDLDAASQGKTVGLAQSPAHNERNQGGSANESNSSSGSSSDSTHDQESNASGTHSDTNSASSNK